jgi:hypothetical protein
MRNPQVGQNGERLERYPLACYLLLCRFTQYTRNKAFSKIRQPQHLVCLQNRKYYVKWQEICPQITLFKANLLKLLK